MKQDIYISVTDKCDLACSFCSAAKEMEHRSRPIAEVEASLEQLKATAELGVVTWGGGEPLLAPVRLERLLGHVKTLWPESKHRLVTNGTHLSKQSLELLNQFDSFVIGVDGAHRSERPLVNFLMRGDYAFFELLPDLRGHLSFRQVIVRSQLTTPEWWVDIAHLHSMLSDVPRAQIDMRITLDCYQTTPLTKWETDNFIEGFRNLSRVSCTPTLRLDKFFVDHFCDCGSVLASSHVGNVAAPGAFAQQLPYGCALLTSSIGKEAYHRISSEFKGVPRG